MAALPLAWLLLVVARYGVNVPHLDQWELVPFLDKSYGLFTLFPSPRTVVERYPILVRYRLSVFRDEETFPGPAKAEEQR